MKIITINYNDKKFHFLDTPYLDILINEIFNDNYKIFEKGLNFQKGDIILDIGANVGVFSILISKLFPDCLIYAIEPIPIIFNFLKQNLELNNINNVIPILTAIDKDNGYVNIKYNQFLGGSSSYIKEEEIENSVNIGSITLSSLIKKINNRIKLLKIDVEGAEYDIIYDDLDCLKNIDFVVGEFHINKYLKSLGYDPFKLANDISQRTNMLYFEHCYMSE